jgi:hypothetical protein
MNVSVKKGNRTASIEVADKKLVPKAKKLAEEYLKRKAVEEMIEELDEKDLKDIAKYCLFHH